MDGPGNNNFAQSSPFVTPAAPTAPPPPSEVKVRTMRSDLDSMAKSGGGLPHFENVKVAGLSMGKPPVAGDAQIQKAGGKNTGIIVLIAVAVLAIIGVVGYFAYQFFLSGSGAAPAPTTEQSQTTPPPQTTPIATPTSTPTAAATAAPFTHASLFVKEPADQTLTLTLSTGGAASTSADLETFNQKLSALLASAKKTATMIEVNVQDAKGNGVPVGDILSAANAAVLDPQFINANFGPDATFFVYQDKNGLWPGYVIPLKAGESVSSLQSEVAKLESSPNIANLFLQNVGSPSPDGFTDSAIDGTTVRVLPYLEASAPTYFTYGWYQTDLVLSASQAGFGAAIGRL